MAFKIRPLTRTDCAALAQFEQTNAAWFETFIPGRDPSYFHPKTLAPIVGDLLSANNLRHNAFYVMMDGDQIIGRINLTHSHNGTAMLGYRVARSHVGKGVASSAMDNIIPIAKNQLGLQKLCALILPHNPASLRVLLKCGFHVTDTRVDPVIWQGNPVTPQCLMLQL